jgi:hypothetical protein
LVSYIILEIVYETFIHPISILAETIARAPQAAARADRRRARLT